FENHLAEDFVGGVEYELPFLHMRLHQLEDVTREHLARMEWNGARQVERGDDGDVVHDDRLTGFGELAVTAGFGRAVHDDRTGAHGFHHVGGDESRGGLAGDLRRGDDEVDLL